MWSWAFRLTTLSRKSERNIREIGQLPRCSPTMYAKIDHERSSQDTWRLTPAERMARFVELQRRAMQLLAASPEGYRRYWERNIRKRSIHAEF